MKRSAIKYYGSLTTIAIVTVTPIVVVTKSVLDDMTFVAKPIDVMAIKPPS